MQWSLAGIQKIMKHGLFFDLCVSCDSVDHNLTSPPESWSNYTPEPTAQEISAATFVSHPPLELPCLSSNCFLAVMTGRYFGPTSILTNVPTLASPVCLCIPPKVFTVS